MIPIPPLELLFEAACGIDLPLPDEIRAAYGRLQFPPPGPMRHVIANFVTSLDGVVALGTPGVTDGDAISGSSLPDSMVMGLLRAASGAVMVGAGTLKKSPLHIWTPEFVYPPLAGAYRMLRARLGMHEPPHFIVVTAGGEVDLSLPAFREGKPPAAVITTEAGERRIRSGMNPAGVRIIAAGAGPKITIRRLLEAVVTVVPGAGILLLEGGPRLIGQFLDAGELDELFLTVSPRVAGRDGKSDRPGLIAGTAFLPDRLVTGNLNGVRKAGSHLFLRYSFTRPEQR
jgi:riboflavin biosynthesis pyrimidine reductase